MATFFCSIALSFYVGSLIITDSRTNVANQYPLNITAAPPYCVPGGLVPAQCTPQQNLVGSLTFGTDADVCACPLCLCGCYSAGAIQTELGLTSATSCGVSGGKVIIAFFAIIIGELAPDRRLRHEDADAPSSSPSLRRRVRHQRERRVRRASRPRLTPARCSNSRRPSRR